ncbi:LL-diaminopimelate aminotransferase [Solidesulfovibrio sp.]|jgi:LL-diaminopimelate aminotransferase|uniref:LL-diaminopimelate aminotransferase n=1 Tax=Solidesulfovibrio sp. TaxID=2910990 RepID=UPI002B2034A6|nr:LL-diaminopimelate aminotransferase [Solidesulfovibrio sp.]MEA5090689.1 LL-diaminopimelate aminotransferase [Solidesulfovibrio sp.]HML59949.1 LL-diaminopimelate aminotransferase [Solidesulfovibrio sp.]
MNESYIQQLFADRIGGDTFGKDTVLYKFEKIKRAKKAALAAHPDVPLIDLGVGEPDWMAAPEVVEVLCAEARKPENRGYTDNGVQVFKDAAARYMAEVYGVAGIDPAGEVVHGIGSKPVLALLPLAFINPGDITIMTVPGYPVMGTTTKGLGGEVVNLPLLAENGFLPDLDALTADQRRRAKLLYINYPNNPTGATATPAFFEKVVRFAKENDVIVVSDAAYGALTFDGRKPLSFLATPGAKDVGVEIHSLSKAYNMTGWRLAFVCGNELVVKGFAAVKDNNDSGQFAAIQKAGVYCLEHPEITEKTAAKYSRRHDMLVAALAAAGFSVKKPGASFYLYARIPSGTKAGRTFASAEDFSQYMITEKLISTVPWDDAGPYVRFSVTFEAADEAEERRIIDEIARRLSDAGFVF